MAEQSFFNEGDVSVTQSRVTIGSTVYPINGITAIRTVAIPARRGYIITIGVVGLLCLLSSIGNGSFMVAIIGVLLIGLTVFLWRQAKPTHQLVFGTAGAEQQALSSKDSAYIVRVSRAINEALVARG